MNSSSPSAPVKRCIHCGLDCSGKPRVKDRQGRYACQTCFDNLQSSPAPIVDDGALPADLLQLEAAATPAATFDVCPNCRSSKPHGAPFCVQCGFDSRTGKTAATVHTTEKVRAVKTKGQCPECGYSLKGLKEPRCPECGTVVVAQTHREQERRDSIRTVRMAYIKPLIQFAIGLLGVGIVLAVQEQESELPGYLLLYGIRVPIGVAGYFICCLIWIGFDEPLHLIALRLAGVYALVDFLSVLLGAFIPIPMLVNVIALVFYVAMLSESLDLDIQDAVIVGMVTFLLRFMAAMAILAYLLSK